MRSSAEHQIASAVENDHNVFDHLLESMIPAASIPWSDCLSSFTSANVSHMRE